VATSSRWRLSCNAAASVESMLIAGHNTSNNNNYATATITTTTPAPA